MSYSIKIIDKNTEETIKVDHNIDVRGCTYAVGGTNKLEFSITFNYAKKMESVFGCKFKDLDYTQIDNLIDLIVRAMSLIVYEPPSDNYWEDTWGNVYKALFDLLQLCMLAPPDARMKIYC